ncbi:DUF6194 family protein [Saccharopolyspora mangrovi]|uniref:DUF6194 family protein n=1 Tax=Saccharopolyspora mangrovi TaxID=3082379 RepID=A0ABU6A8A2_9PSEU|nr:DUF6194 family protein [Saccharopolyspora sp. S2-29]MEB3367619.1 DUF6194 family protein [Saccharopolyspora sp. S2-29]
MSMEHLLTTVRTFDGVLELAPTAGGEFPEIAWGDHFFYYAPDGRVPEREQPYATFVTKNYPGDDRCDLDVPGRWRLNVHVGRDVFTELTGEDPRSGPAAGDLTATDVVFGHPLYRALGWVSIINPARTHALAIDLLRGAHETARQRANRRSRR